MVNQRYKIVRGMKYIDTFPEEWINDEHKDCGPHNCLNCLSFGTYKAVFIGYCVNCADTHDLKRGNGMLEPVVELGGDEDTSMWNTYMQNIDMVELVNMNPSWIEDISREILLRHAGERSLNDMQEDISRYILMHNSADLESRTDFTIEYDDTDDETDDDMPELEYDDPIPLAENI